ncbi:MAG: hypothetical protein O8C62_04420 [Candidatus Methanoperedens sp.]|nr:hypothetical protein [Candidatus Methanoperedens sp.]
MNEKIPIYMIERHLSAFPNLESLMKDSICEIYNKDRQTPLGYGLGWALRDSMICPMGQGTVYLDSLELNLCSIVGKIDEQHLIIFKKRLVGNFWETFPEIQTLGAICRAGKKVQMEKPLSDGDSDKTFDFFILQPEIFIEVYCPFSKDYHDETAKWAGIGEELREKFFKKYDKKKLKDTNSCYPVFLIINTSRLLDKDEIHASEIIDPISKKYVFPKNVHCYGAFLYEPKFNVGDTVNVYSQAKFCPNCSEELKAELTKIFNELR